jgi:ACS family tartrate transporter-like MFS transporter
LAVLIWLTDRPRQAHWLTPDERDALEAELERERLAKRSAHGHMTWSEALKHPKVLLLAAAYFFIVTGNYGVESFLPTILKKWYSLTKDQLRMVLLVPALGSLLGQLFIGWSSDRTKERRYHAAIPIYIGAAALACTVLHAYPLAIMVVFFAMAATGLKAYLPAFWSLPSLFLTEAAAASSIGLINSVGNLGGFIGPKVLGYVETKTGSFKPGILFLCASMAISATIIITLSLDRQKRDKPATSTDLS